MVGHGGSTFPISSHCAAVMILFKSVPVHELLLLAFSNEEREPAGIDHSTYITLHVFLSGSWRGLLRYNLETRNLRAVCLEVWTTVLEYS